MRLLIPACVLSQASISTIINERNHHKQHSGSAIAEYVLIGAGITVLSIVGLAVLGNTLSGAFHGMMNKDQLQPQIAANANAKVASLTGGLSPASLSSAKASTVAGNMQTSVQSQVTQTSGANGTTEAYSQNILKAGKQALADGKINQAQYDLFMQMANQGHEMAVMEGLMTKAFQQAQGDIGVYNNNYITYNGQSYTPNQLNRLLDSASHNLDNLDRQLSVEQIPGLTNVAETVVIAKNKIHTIAADNLNADSTFGSISLENLYPNYSAETSTNQQSANICTAGQDKDTNNHCTN